MAFRRPKKAWSLIVPKVKLKEQAITKQKRSNNVPQSHLIKLFRSLTIQMDTIENTIGDYNNFLDDVYTNIKGVGIDVSDFPIDHIAYRTTTKERYESIRNELHKFGTILSEIIIRERPVAIFKLNNPLDYKGMKISFFEILAPAQGDTFYTEGLEHAEFVVNSPLSEIINKYPLIDFYFNKSEINPELILRFPIQANVKFHEIPIDEVIKLQESQL